MLADKTINAIIHEVNVSHNLNCNTRARYQIMKHCVILSNEAIIDWNEEGYWLNCNPNATVSQVKTIRNMIKEGTYKRGFEFEEETANE